MYAISTIVRFSVTQPMLQQIVPNIRIAADIMEVIVELLRANGGIAKVKMWRIMI
jgi:hypothetical protein